MGMFSRLRGMDVLAGALPPLREAIRGDDAFEKFGTAVTTGAERFFKKGTEEWIKFEDEEEKIRDRINLLMSQYGVVNKEVAVAVSGMPDEEFNSLLTNFKEAQQTTRKTLAFRDFINAQDVPMEAVPVGELPRVPGPIGPSDTRVIEDLTADTIDSSVRRVVGTVTPGTLSDKQTKTFMGHLGDEFARRGFGDPARRGDLIRMEALQEAMTQRPAGVSEEEWLGFMEGKIRERDPSDVTFRVPFSRKAELASLQAEATYSKTLVDLRTAQRKLTSEEDMDRPLAWHGFNIEDPILKELASSTGITLDKNTTYRQFAGQFTAMDKVAIIFERIMKGRGEGVETITVPQASAIISQAYRIYKDRFGSGSKYEAVSQTVSYEDDKQFGGNKQNMLQTTAIGYGDIMETAIASKLFKTKAQAHNFAMQWADKHIPAIIVDEITTLKEAGGETGWLDIIEQAGDDVTDRTNVADKIIAQLRDPKGKAGEYVRTQGIKSILTTRSIGTIADYLRSFAKNPQTNRLDTGNAGRIKFINEYMNRDEPEVGAAKTEVGKVTTVPFPEGVAEFDLTNAILGAFQTDEQLYEATNKLKFNIASQNIIVREMRKIRPLIMKNPKSSDAYQAIYNMVKKLKSGVTVGDGRKAVGDGRGAVGDGRGAIVDTPESGFAEMDRVLAEASEKERGLMSPRRVGRAALVSRPDPIPPRTTEDFTTRDSQIDVILKRALDEMPPLIRSLENVSKEEAIRSIKDMVLNITNAQRKSAGGRGRVVPLFDKIGDKDAVAQQIAKELYTMNIVTN